MKPKVFEADAARFDPSGEPLLLHHWRGWDGGIDCGLSGRVWPAADLRELSSATALRLASLGLGPGDPVLLMLGNTAAFPVCLMALLELGCNPLLTHAGSNAPTVARLAAEFGVGRILHDFLDEVTVLPRSAYPEVGRVEAGPLAVSVLGTERTTARPIGIPGSGVVLHPTSGTYGAAKYCVRNQAAAVAEGRNYFGSIDVYDRARTTVTTPLTHAYAYGFGLVSAILTHSTLALDVAFNPKRILRREREARSDILAIVPPMARALVDVAGNDPDRAMARTVFYAGAPIDPVVARQFEGVFGAPLFAILGTTETGAVSTSYARVGKLTGVGRPLGNVAIAIDNPEPYRGLAPGAGELRVRSSSMMQGYVPGIGGTAIDFFPTGDIGFVDGAGCLNLVGRIRDIINLGGMKVDPAEVEAVLLSHPSVTDAAVYPGLRDGGGEFVQAAVAGRNIDIEGLRRRCLAELDAHKVPAAIHVVDRIPRTPSGKCLKVQCPDYPQLLLIGADIVSTVNRAGGGG